MLQNDKNNNKRNTKIEKRTAEFDEIMSACKQKLNALEINFKDVTDKMNEMHHFVLDEKQQHNKMIDMTEKYTVCTSDIIKLNVGGTLFSTLKSTLDQKIKKVDEDGYHDPNVLQLLVSGFVKPVFDEDKAIFIDRDPQYFRYIIDYLRTVKSEKEFTLPDLNSWDINKFKIEVEFYKLNGLLPLFECLTTFNDCLILTKPQVKELNKLCEFGNKANWKLLYRASEDGFGSDEFHTLCDGINNTLTIVKTTNNYIFGGFTSVVWDVSDVYKDDSSAFIFTLTNHENRPLKLKCTRTPYAIRCGSVYGPTFGGGHDFYIATNSNSNTTSYSYLGHSYSKGGSKSSKTLLAGSYNFQVEEIEVFQKL